jgi:hypothetical protein
MRQNVIHVPQGCGESDGVGGDLFGEKSVHVCKVFLAEPKTTNRQGRGPRFVFSKTTQKSEN